jgi:8-oxo-(d)GTP phosphatase
MSGAAGGMIRAAGGVLWRAPGSGAVEVALVHRPGYGDWSLPKGKLLRGEHPLVTACREVAEETGIRAVAGLRLAIEHYGTAAGPKAVEYWAMHGPDSVFAPTTEVDRLSWLPLPDARRRLSYQRDSDALDALEMLEGDAATAGPAVLMVRNGHAVPPRQWAGSDGDRPLDAEGHQQATAVRRVLPAFASARLFSAPPTRCADTMEPLGAELGLPVETEPALDEDGYAADPRRGLTRILELASAAGGTAVCASGVVIQHLLAAFADEAGLHLPEIQAGNGSVWALFFSHGRLAAADYYPDLIGPGR